MIRFALRFVGFWLLAGAFVALVYDGTRSIAGNQVILTSMTETWSVIDSSGLASFETGVKRSFAPWVWDPVLRTILLAPTTLVLGLLGAALVLLGRKRPPLIGYARR